jgi:hypothetical protein
MGVKQRGSHEHSDYFANHTCGMSLRKEYL